MMFNLNDNTDGEYKSSLHQIVVTGEDTVATLREEPLVRMSPETIEG